MAAGKEGGKSGVSAVEILRITNDTAAYVFPCVDDERRLDADSVDSITEEVESTGRMSFSETMETSSLPRRLQLLTTASSS